MCKLHVNTKPFYISDLNNHRFWYLWGPGINPPQTLYYIINGNLFNPY